MYGIVRNSGNGDLTSQPVKGFMGMQLVSGLLTAAKDLADAECELNETGERRKYFQWAAYWGIIASRARVKDGVSVATYS